MQSAAESEVVAAEHEMFAQVLAELFLGVLSGYKPRAWHDTAVHRLSRGTAPKLWACLTTAHAAGMRMDPRAAAQAEAIDVLCETERKPSGEYDSPTDLTVLVVTREVANAVLEHAASGAYNSPDEVVGTALHALQWAENNPEGQRHLLRLALQAGDADSEAGRLIPADAVFARARERARGDAR
jgi:Arc/MetJ-type ribon-helix-helix transcriptional regulator